LLIIITIALRAYLIIFLKQVKLRTQTQKTFQELALAYEKVEELTLANERQRMARDLHDTLSQGLAGVIMQLEAVNANIKNNNIARAQEIVQKSMEHARKTLADSRLVIDDLRLHAGAEMNLNDALLKEISQCRNISSTHISYDIRIKSKISSKTSKHILYIVREALNNIAKHSEAKNAAVEIIETHNQVNINIKDDGIGFDVKLLEQMFGHYGLLGMTERVKSISGTIKIKSKRKLGTNINIIIPIEKGIDEDNV
jgi:NarL family two-component system sensor histidine kinase YdfH